MLRSSLLLLLAAVIFGCTEQKADEVIPGVDCSNQLVIESVTENFCDTYIGDFKSNLEVGSGLYVQYLIHPVFNSYSSENYERYNIAFANVKPDSSDWESEAKFFENLIELLRPETKHKLDITELGGFAIELWDLNGEYYSSEFGEQETDTFIETRRMTLTFEGPTYNQVDNFMEFYLVSSKPIIVWNQTGTVSLTVDTNYSWHIIDFRQF